MSNTVQEFMAGATLKAAADLTTAFLRIPEDKREWSPDTRARTALDQYAECALLCGYTAETIETRQMAAGSLEKFSPEKTKLKTQDWQTLHNLFQTNTAKIAEVIRTITDEDMGTVIVLPWRPMTVAQLISYPQWNMTYHEGQINYIASILGCLE